MLSIFLVGKLDWMDSKMCWWKRYINILGQNWIAEKQKDMQINQFIDKLNNVQLDFFQVKKL